MKRLYLPILICLLVICIRYGHGQSFSYTAEIVELWSTHTGDGPGAGNADITWQVKIELLTSANGVIRTLNEDCIHQPEYQGGWINRSYTSAPLNTTSIPFDELCGSPLRMKVTFDCWENDDGDDCTQGWRDDHFSGVTISNISFTGICPNANQDNYRVFSTLDNDYKVRVRFRYTIDVLENAAVERTFTNGDPLGDEICDGDIYKVGIVDYPIWDGDVKFLRWERRPVTGGSWEFVNEGWSLDQLSVQAEFPGYDYRVRSYSNTVCLGENNSNWQETQGTWNVLRKAPFPQVNLFRACAGQSNGTIEVNYSGSGSDPSDVKATLLKLVNGIYVPDGLPITEIGTNYPVTFNRSAGNYGVILTRESDNGLECSRLRENIILRAVNFPAISISVEDQRCFGQDDGYAYVYCSSCDEVSISGPVSGTQSIPLGYGSGGFFDLPPGTYTATATNLPENCVSTTTFIVEPLTEDLSATYTTEDATCFTSHGKITVTDVSGGRPFSSNSNYDYLLRLLTDSIYQGNIAFTDSYTYHLLPGTYNIMYRDSRGCRDTLRDIEVMAPPPHVTLHTEAFNGTSCMPEGIIVATASSGTPPYQYKIDGQNWQASDTFFNLLPGNKRIRVRDADFCKASDWNTLTSTTNLMLSVEETAPTCADSSMAQLTTTQSGGNTSGDYLIEVFYESNQASPIRTLSTSSNTSVFNGFVDSTYLVRLTDVDGCTAETTLDIEDLVVPQIIAVRETEPDCFDDPLTRVEFDLVGRADGSNFTTNVFISIDGGTSQSLTEFDDYGSYSTYRFTPDNPTGTFTAEDDLGCPVEGTYAFDIPLPDTLKARILWVDSATCRYNNDGEIAVEIIGGQKPYTVVLEKLIQVNSFYPLHVETILETYEDTIVFRGLDYSVPDDSPTGNQWGGGYSVWVREANNLSCAARTSDRFYMPGASEPTNLYAPDVVNITLNNIGPDLNCTKDNGIIEVIATGGTPPYEYSVDNVNWQSSNIVNSTDNSTDVYVRDAYGCTDSDNMYISNAPNPIQVDVISISEGSECTPRVDSVVLTGVTDGYDIQSIGYFCSGGEGPRSQTEDDRDNQIIIRSFSANHIVIENPNPNDIPFGCNEIQIRILDSASCSKVFTLYVPFKNRLPKLEKESSTGISCLGESDGSVTYNIVDSAFILGDYNDWNLAPPFTVTLNNSFSQVITDTPYTVTFSNMAAGLYLMTVEDSFGCLYAVVDSLKRLYPYDYTISNTAVAGCGTDSTGQISVTINGGGSLPYNWTWYTDEADVWVQVTSPQVLNAGESTILNNLPVTTYQAVVSDANSCVDTLTFDVAGPPVLSILKRDSLNPSCNAGSNGVISVKAIGGTAPLQYSIDNGMSYQTDTLFTNLAAGTYTVIVQDGNGCFDSVHYHLTEPAEIDFTSVVLEDVSCFDGSNGSISVTAGGGQAPLSYALDGGAFQASGDFQGLSAGNYFITVRDANLCSRDTLNLVIGAPSEISINISIVDSLTCLQPAKLVADVNGGTPNYTYSWNSGQSTTDTLQAVGSGQHIIQITDDNGCIKSDTIQLNMPDNPTLSILADTAEACDMSDGSFLVNASNGRSPYMYSANGMTNQSGYFTGLPADQYEVIAIDNIGCRDTIDVTIDSISGPRLTEIDTIQTTCAGDNGSISLTIADGTPPYSYRWSHDTMLNSATAVNLAEGDYFVTITDARMCFTSTMIHISETPSPTLSPLLVVNSSCGMDNGMATVAVNGGAPGFTFEWSHDNAITGPSAMDLPPALYAVVVTDQNSCKDTLQVEIFENIAPSLSVESVQDATCGDMNGLIRLTVTSTHPPFIYTWSHNTGTLDSAANNLAEGNYRITVTDGNNCTDTISVNISNVAGPTLSIAEVTNSTCSSGNGQINLQPVNGTAPYTYQWSHDGLLGDSIATDLLAGLYSVTVSDGNACTDTITQSIADENVFSGSILSATQSGCDTASGTILLNMIGGESPYLYTWSHDGTANTNYVDSLAAGFYQVTVTDALGCEIVIDTTISTAAGPTISLLASTNSYCGPNMGAAIVTASGGTGPYTFEWNHNPALTDSFASDLPGGGISVLVRDQNNCTDDVQFLIDETNPVDLLIDSFTHETCALDNGTVILNYTGGFGTVTYEWSHDNTLSTSIAQNLSSGTYFVTATDAVGCFDTIQVNIDSIAAPVLQVDLMQNNSCEQQNGFIQLNVLSGTAPFLFQWSHDINLDAPIATGLSGGSYQITVSDASLCIDTASVELTNDQALDISLLNIIPESCNGLDGSISTSTIGGLAPFSFEWSHDVTLNDTVATGLMSGSYTAIVGDALGCADTLQSMVPHADTPMLNIVSTIPNTCGLNDGSIAVTGAGGGRPYTYAWSHDGSLTDSLASNLMDDDYSVTVTDAFGCVDTLQITLPCFTALAIIVTDTSNETCGLSNGSVSIQIVGGTSPYSFLWSHDNTLDTNVVEDLQAGMYEVTVTDAFGDMTSAQIQIFNEESPVLQLEQSLSNNCPTGSNGLISVSGMNGSRPYAYQWSHDGLLTDSVAMELNQGSYTVVVIDANNCRDTLMENIMDEELLSSSFMAVTETECVMATGAISIQSSLGRPPYFYNWSHDGTVIDSFATELAAGHYSITISDLSGCAIEIDTTIAEAQSPDLSLLLIEPSTCDADNGRAIVQATGGLAPYTYAWSHDTTLIDSIAINLTEGSYNVTVTDINLCTDTLTINVGGSPPIVVIPVDSVQETCGLGNGSLTISASGGLTPYSYRWSHDTLLNDSVALGLGAGFYEVAVRGQNGCSDTLMLSISNVEGPSITLDSKQDNSCSQSNGELIVTSIGGLPPYSYAWSHDNTLTDSMATDLPAGNYVVTVTDFNGCEVTLTETIIDLAIFDFNLASIVQTTCGANDGLIVIAGSGGIYPYSYVWNHDPTETDSIADNLGSGFYSVTVTDNRGCEEILMTEVTTTDGPTAELIDMTSSSCELENGSAIVRGINGQSPYTFAWSHDGTLTDSIAVQLGEGTYTVTVTDLNACSDQLNIIIGGSPALLLTVVDSQNEMCSSSDGYISLSSIQGSRPTTYAWSHDGSLMDSVATNLTAGIYRVMGSDNMGCQDSVQITLTNTPGPVITNISSVDNSCTQDNGQITIQVADGTPNYSYSWSHNMMLNDSIASNLPAGEYIVTITDDNQCSTIGVDTIQDLNVLDFTVSSVVSTGCTSSNGIVTISGGGGIYPYQYAWSHDLTETDSVAENLAAGMYTVTVSDNRGCFEVLVAEVMTTDGPSISLVSMLHSTCDLENGMAVVEGLNGTPPYAYTWSHDTMLVDSLAISLAEGIYFVTVTDANFCTDQLSIAVDGSPELGITVVDSINETCSAANGSISLTALNGSRPVSYIWSHDGSVMDSLAVNLSAGSYTVIGTDMVGCRDTAMIVLSNTPGPAAVAMDVEDNSCSQANGQMSVAVTGGTPMYTYEWSHDTLLHDSIATNLSAGAYSVTITDANQCIAIATDTIETAPILDFIIESTSMTACGMSSGSIVLSGDGGRYPYTYEWSHDTNLTDSIATALATGSYSITVTDARGCQVLLSTEIFETNPPILNLDQVVHSSCELSNGMISVIASGGQGPYTFAWGHDINASDSVVVGLSADTYNVTVVDANACSDTLHVVVEGTPSIDLSIANVIHETCGASNGSIILTSTGGSVPISYTWSHDATLNDSVALNLAARTYFVTATDFYNCTDTISIDLSNADGPQLDSVTVLSNSCSSPNGFIQVSFSTSSPPLSYSWSHDANLNADSAMNLLEGVYHVTVTDDIGCVYVHSETVLNQFEFDFNILSVNQTGCQTSTGEIVLSGSGGSYPYTYAWSHDVNETDSVASNLGAGLYVVTVTDDRGCFEILDTEVMQSNSPTLSLVQSASSMCGLNNGSAVISSVGGAQPYIYAWDHDVTLSDSIATDLGEGMYTVTVTDGNGCIDVLSFSIGGSPEVMMTIVEAVDEDCGSQNGLLRITTQSGSHPILYSWNHDATLTDSVATGLTAGSYLIVGIDAFGCRDTILTSLMGTDEITTAVQSSSDNTCSMSNGQIILTVINGIPPLTYQWSHDATLNDSIANNLTGGTYVVIIEDANGCHDTLEHSIGDSAPLSFQVDQVDSSACFPGTGSISVLAMGGVLPYTFTWGHDANLNSNIANNLVAEIYDVSVTDAVGCLEVLQVEVPQFEGPVAADVVISPAVCDGATGSIQLNISGGLPPYSIEWSHDPTLTGPIADNLDAGLYLYTIRDARNCMISDVVVVTSSSGIAIALDSAQRPACEMTNGFILISISGGNGPYDIEWYNADDITAIIGSGVMLDNLSAGEYVVMAADGDGCTDLTSFILQDIEDMSALVIAIDETCFDADNGLASISVTAGGTSPFQYQWDDANQTATSTISPLAEGLYHVTITDANGCTLVDSAEIGQPAEVVIDTFIIPPGCQSPDGASIFVDAEGGVGPFIYLWPNEGVGGQTLSNITAGVYDLYIEDSTGCSQSYLIEVPTIDDITISAGEVEPPACDLSQGGSLTVNVIGGQPPYTIVWNDALMQEGSTALDLQPGVYMAYVADQAGCMDTLSMEVPETPGVAILLNEIQAPVCADEANGEIEVVVSGGSGNYAYLWDDSNFQMTARAVSLTAGSYIVRVTDIDLGCINRDTFELTDPAALVIDSFQVMDVSCFGGSTGLAAVFASGGTGNLSYQWNDDQSQMSDTAINLDIGTYAVTVTDINGCIVSAETGLTQPAPISFVVVDSQGVTCNGAHDAFAKVDVQGGVAPYDIFWLTTGTAGDSIGNLMGGTYQAEIQDANDCRDTIEVILHEPDSVRITLIDLVDANCSGAQMGQISIEASGGTGGYMYLWDDDFNQITSTAFNLDSGIYTVIVADENNCQNSASFEITGLSELLIDVINVVQPSCFGDQNGSVSISVEGGNNDYVYLWNDPALQTDSTAIGLTAGEYIVFVSNGDGTCPTRDTVALQQPEEIMVTHQIWQQVLCFGDSNAVAKVNVTGGTTPYEFDWLELGIDLGDSLTNLYAGIFNLEIRDEMGCHATHFLEITEPNLLEASELVIDPLCFGDENGSISVLPSGGTSPYDYSWVAPFSDSLSQVSNIGAGSYSVTVIDNNNCSLVISPVLIDQSAELLFAVEEFMLPSCVGADNGLISIMGSGGAGDLNYDWSNGVTGSINEDLLPGVYSVTISDVLGCELDTAFNINDVDDLDLELAFTDTMICQGQIINIVANSFPGATYSWTGPNGYANTDSIISVGAAGQYSLTAIVSICSDTASVFVQNTNSVLQSQFIIPTQVLVDDTIVALETSWPVPTNVSWTYDADSIMFVAQAQNQWLFTFPYVGEFDIELIAELTGCTSSVTKSIVVHQDSSTFEIPQSTGDKQILSFRITPNPSTGIFSAEFDLAQTAPYYLNAYRLDGTAVENRQGNGAGLISELFNFNSAVNGLYVVSLQSEGEVVWTIVKIERP